MAGFRHHSDPERLPLVRTVGENGAPARTAEGVGNARVALFFGLVRGLSSRQLDELFAEAWAEAMVSASESPEQRIIMRSQAVADLVVMIVQTRDVRGGKGERDLFRSLLTCMHTRLPRTAEALLPIITTQSYGSFKDIVQLIEQVDYQTAKFQVDDGCRTGPSLSLKTSEV
eukprot:jgi/Tetstr1/443624/TSEL_031623.t1